MGKSTKRHPTEIRFSPLSLLCLFFVWVGVSGLAFYVGVLVGRMEKMREIRIEYQADESAVATEELPPLSFEELLPAPDEERAAGPPSPVPNAETQARTTRSSEMSGSAGSAVLQVASFRKPELAEQLVRDLRKKGYRCFQSTSGPSREAGGFCKVFIGPLQSVEMAMQVKEHLEKKEGYEGILIRSVGKKKEEF